MMMSNWRFRKGSQADQRVRLKCGCVYNCYDPDKTIFESFVVYIESDTERGLTAGGSYDRGKY